MIGRMPVTARLPHQGFAGRGAVVYCIAFNPFRCLEGAVTAGQGFCSRRDGLVVLTVCGFDSARGESIRVFVDVGLMTHPDQLRSFS